MRIPSSVDIPAKMDPDSVNWEHCLDYVAVSDVGLRRANNQDSKAVVVANSQEDFVRRGHLFVVADGMGAHAAGELASKLAADVVPQTYRKLLDRPAPEALLAAIHDANNQIHSRGQASEDFKGMGTTISALAILPQGALLAHVGDSRAYRLRGARLEQLTFDHSLVWELRRAGRGSMDQALPNVPKNIITRSLGPKPKVEIDREGPFPLQVGDTFLLCSDGLSGQVDNEEMGTILYCLPPKEAIRVLVDLANLRGGPDNITVIVVRVTGPQVIRGGAGARETTSSVGPAGRPVHPLLWTLLAVLGLATVGLFGLGSAVAGLASLIAAVVTGVVILVQRYADATPDFRPDGQPLGHGPYVACQCEPNAQVVGRLGEVTQQLRNAAADGDWSVFWDQFNAFEAHAAAAAKSADYVQAVREYGHAIISMMDQLRSQRARKAGESGAGLLEP
jgi:serine/threonine protein phosphatase PrpC